MPPDEPVHKCELKIGVAAEACMFVQYKTHVKNTAYKKLQLAYS